MLSIAIRVTMKKRTSKITNEQVKSIFEQMEQGVSLRKACESQKVKPNTFLNLKDKDEKLSEQYARSMEKGLMSRAGDMLDYAKDSKDDPYTKKLYIDTLKWVLSKQLPKKFGDKLEVEGKNIAPTTIIIKRADE